MSQHERSYAIRSASDAALLKWREVHAAKVAAGQTDRQMLDHIEAELAERQADPCTVVTYEYFDHLVRETERPAREPNAKMAQLLRDTQGGVEHR